MRDEVNISQQVHVSASQATLIAAQAGNAAAEP